MNHSPKRSGFTLIELLVVIAIIAILAAILFPVFAQAKNAAKKTQSLSNVKQLGTSMMLYLGDSDDTYPMSEYGGGGSGMPQMTWASTVFPYIRNGARDLAGMQWANSGLFRSPGNPRPETVAQSSGSFSYGVHYSLFVNNFEHTPAAGAPNPGVSASVVDLPADKIAILEKGTNAPADGWNYPWFHDWQQMYVGSILATPGDPSTLLRDGVDVYTVGGPMFDPRFDSDCGPASSGAWECAAHPRYRFTNTTLAAFADGHAKSVRKGGLRWFQNIWIDRRNINRYNWFYGYQNDGGWGFPGIH